MELPPCAALSARETLGVMDTSDVQLPPYPQGGNHTFFFSFSWCVSLVKAFMVGYASCFLVLVNSLFYIHMIMFCGRYKRLLICYLFVCCFSQLISVNGYGFTKYD